MSWKKWLIRSRTMLVLVMLAASMSGCNVLSFPFRMIEGVVHLTKLQGVRDAKTQRVEQWPGLRVDAALEAELDAAMGSDDLAMAKGHAKRFLNKAHKLALDTTRVELDRVDDKGWQELAARYFRVDVLPTGEIKRDIFDAFKEQTDLQYWFLSRRIQDAQNVAQIDEVLEPIRQNIEPPVKDQGRFARAAPFFLFSLPSALAVASIHSNEWRGDLDVPFEAAVQYVPTPGSASLEPANTPDHWDLLQRFAPVITQEYPAEVTYPRTTDRIGKVWADHDENIHIDTDQPSVYAYAREVLMNGHRRIQLTYTHWYPQHPKLKNFDPEAGKIEGVTFRITLNTNQRPAVVETLYNCGCYHRAYPADYLETAARAQFGEPESGKTLVIEHNVPGKIDMIVPKAVHVPQGPTRPIVRYRAGNHAIVNVAFDTDGHENEVIGKQSYTLLPYEQLERLVEPDGRVTSMFQDNGLVRNAQRIEGIFFTPLGMLSSGQPRQRGTQTIHWDHYGFDDPDLFEKTMRLPDVF